MEQKIRPYKQLTLYELFMVIMVISVPITITYFVLLVVFNTSIEETYYFILFAWLFPLLYLIYSLVINSLYRYVIDEKYLIKYKGKKIEFKIKIIDIIGVDIKKKNLREMLYNLLVILSNGRLNPISDVVSFKYKQCEIVTKNKLMEKVYYFNKEENSIYEYQDYMSIKDIKKIMKLISIENK